MIATLFKHAANIQVMRSHHRHIITIIRCLWFTLGLPNILPGAFSMARGKVLNITPSIFKFWHLMSIITNRSTFLLFSVLLWLICRNLLVRKQHCFNRFQMVNDAFSVYLPTGAIIFSGKILTQQCFHRNRTLFVAPACHPRGGDSSKFFPLCSAQKKFEGCFWEVSTEECKSKIRGTLLNSASYKGGFWTEEAESL